MARHAASVRKQYLDTDERKGSGSIGALFKKRRRGIMVDLDPERNEKHGDGIELMKFSGSVKTDNEPEDTYRRAKRTKIVSISLIAASLVIGWLVGSFFPVAGADAIRRGIRNSQSMNASDKIRAAFDIMENDWFFGKDIEDLDTRLSDQALYGIFANEEDPHTEYMSAEEVTEFRQSIDRNFVGIGVEFIANNGINVVTKVFRGAPADQAGVQAGDIIAEVDGESTDGMTSTDIKERVQGEEGTDVKILFMRQGEPVEITITRAEISATAYGYQMDEKTGYLQLYQFGTGTAEEIDRYLAEFRAADIHKLIIDLRDNGGGYLDALAQVASRFLPGNTLVMSQEYPDGSQEHIYTESGYTQDYNGIVILINENTASASEVFTLAMMEQRDDVTVVGTKSYGKGTVQITRMFTDGSAIKYTTSKWISPNGVWVNRVGIEPDETVEIPEGAAHVYTGMEEDAELKADTVAAAVADIQIALDYLGYTVDRKDGYFSKSTEEALAKFAADNELTFDGALKQELYEAVVSAVIMDWSTTDTHDTQLHKAQEILNG